MGGRLSLVAGSGLVTAAVVAALLAGAGVAAAEPDGDGSASTTSTAQTNSPPSDDRPARTPRTPRDSGDNSGGERDKASAAPGSDEDAEGDEDDAGGNALDVADLEVGSDVDPDVHADTGADEILAAETEDPDPATVSSPSLPVAPVRSEPAAAHATLHKVLARTTPTTTGEALTPLPTLTTARAESAASPSGQTLLSVIGTAVFTLYGAAIRVLGGPPQLPPNSSVTVQTSSLTIDCGDGYEVQADWYVPDGPTPTRLIYFQHGFLAAGPFYSYTAARLAESTHSIVVAPTLTSNFLSCDGCWVGGSPMHQAVADLFADGNTALADSALAAGYSATLLDGIDKVALIGHSAGGGLSAGTAGYMAENGTLDRLAGVVMLDGVGFGDVTPEALAKLPDDFPIYNLAARAYFWNLSGTTNTQLETWRPGGFNGVKLTNSSHGDAMTGGNPIVQVGMNLVTGWPRPENVAAAEKISAGWLNDMFSDTDTSGYYGTPGQTLDIETASGTAKAHVLPGPSEAQTIVDVVFTLGAKVLFGIDFATCAVAPGVDAAKFTQLSTVSAPNTLLSLDGRTKPSQSIGQQCVHG